MKAGNAGSIEEFVVVFLKPGIEEVFFARDLIVMKAIKFAKNIFSDKGVGQNEVKLVGFFFREKFAVARGSKANGKAGARKIAAKALKKRGFFRG